MTFPRWLLFLLLFTSVALADTPGPNYQFSTPLTKTGLNIGCQSSSGSQAGCLASADWTTFNGKQSPLTFTAPLVNSTGTVSCATASGSQAGCLGISDWNTFNGKQNALAFGNLTTGSGLTVIGGTSSVIGSGASISIAAGSYLPTTADQSNWNSKEPALTKGNLTEATSSVLTIAGGTNAVIGSGTSIQVKQASASQPGYVSSSDYNIFNNDPSRVFQRVWDFLGYYQCSDTITPDLIYGSASGTGAACTLGGGIAPLDLGHPGLLKLNMGTTTSGSVFVLIPIGAVYGGGTFDNEWLINVPTLSNSTDRYTCVFGIGSDQTAATAITTGVYFKYSDNINSGDWTEGASTNNARTEQDSGVAVATGWTKIKSSANAAGTSVQFYVNGVAAGSPITTNIPANTANTRGMGPYAACIKSLGTTSTATYADYTSVREVFATPR